MSSYIIGIDQSTQGTKALLFDEAGTLLHRADQPHRQIVDERGYVSHDPEEIFRNTLKVTRTLLEESGIDKAKVRSIGISNQRETTVLWDARTGKSLQHAVVWQCARGAKICERDEIQSAAESIRAKTGIPLSPYYPAAKMAWLLSHTDERERLCLGTIDSFLLFRLTEGRSFQTDFSNASRTQLFDIFQLRWDEELCALFGIDPASLPEVTDSDSLFGETVMEGLFDAPVPIHAMLGDSHGALFGQGCLSPGMLKATYGTGSSIMMNTGEKPAVSTHGVVTSLAWKLGGKVNYVLEGNINYTGAIITWLKDDVRLIASPGETEALCRDARSDDSLYLVPAFTGLGAPHWASHARGQLTGIDRTTGKNEIVRAGVEAIAYQIADVVLAMEQDAGTPVTELRVDGGPTGNTYLMHFQSDILKKSVLVPDTNELSGIGAAYAAGLASGLYDESVFTNLKRKTYLPAMEEDRRRRKYHGWKEAVRLCIQAKPDQPKEGDGC